MQLNATNENCIVTVRECLKAIKHNEELMSEYMRDINRLCDKYQNIATKKKRNQTEIATTDSSIEFEYTGRSTKCIARRKGF